MRFDGPYIAQWCFGPAVRDLEQGDGFTPDDREPMAQKECRLLYPAVAARAGYVMIRCRLALRRSSVDARRLLMASKILSSVCMCA
jgi:hypothetical protein